MARNGNSTSREAGRRLSNGWRSEGSDGGWRRRAKVSSFLRRRNAGFPLRVGLNQRKPDAEL